MTLCDKAYNHLSRMLARGALRPDQKLSERSVSLACGVSRIPVREAIRRLVEEGVLYQKSQSGTYVARLDRQQIVDAYEVREAIETYQLRKAMPRLTDAQKRRLSESCDAQYAIIRAFRESGRGRTPGRNGFQRRRIALGSVRAVPRRHRTDDDGCARHGETRPDRI